MAVRSCSRSPVRRQESTAHDLSPQRHLVSETTKPVAFSEMMGWGALPTRYSPTRASRSNSSSPPRSQTSCGFRHQRHLTPSPTKVVTKQTLTSATVGQRVSNRITPAPTPTCTPTPTPTTTPAQTPTHTPGATPSRKSVDVNTTKIRVLGAVRESPSHADVAAGARETAQRRKTAARRGALPMVPVFSSSSPASPIASCDAFGVAGDGAAKQANSGSTVENRAGSFAGQGGPFSALRKGGRGCKDTDRMEGNVKIGAEKDGLLIGDKEGREKGMYGGGSKRELRKIETEVEEMFNESNGTLGLSRKTLGDERVPSLSLDRVKNAYRTGNGVLRSWTTAGMVQAGQGLPPARAVLDEVEQGRLGVLVSTHAYLFHLHIERSSLAHGEKGQPAGEQEAHQEFHLLYVWYGRAAETGARTAARAQGARLLKAQAASKPQPQLLEIDQGCETALFLALFSYMLPALSAVILHGRDEASEMRVLELQETPCLRGSGIALAVEGDASLLAKHGPLPGRSYVILVRPKRRKVGSGGCCIEEQGDREAEGDRGRGSVGTFDEGYYWHGVGETPAVEEVGNLLCQEVDRMFPSSPTRSSRGGKRKGNGRRRRVGRGDVGCGLMRGFVADVKIGLPVPDGFWACILREMTTPCAFAAKQRKVLSQSSCPEHRSRPVRVFGVCAGSRRAGQSFVWEVTVGGMPSQMRLSPSLSHIVDAGGSHVYVWHGTGSTGDGRRLACRVAHAYASRIEGRISVQQVEAGSEPIGFLDCFIGWDQALAEPPSMMAISPRSASGLFTGTFASPLHPSPTAASRGASWSIDGVPSGLSGCGTSGRTQGESGGACMSLGSTSSASRLTPPGQRTPPSIVNSPPSLKYFRDADGSASSPIVSPSRDSPFNRGLPGAVIARSAETLSTPPQGRPNSPAASSDLMIPRCLSVNDSCDHQGVENDGVGRVPRSVSPLSFLRSLSSTPPAISELPSPPCAEVSQTGNKRLVIVSAQATPLKGRGSSSESALPSHDGDSPVVEDGNTQREGTRAPTRLQEEVAGTVITGVVVDALGNTEGVGVSFVHGEGVGADTGDGGCKGPGGRSKYLACQDGEAEHGREGAGGGNDNGNERQEAGSHDRGDGGNGDDSDGRGDNGDRGGVGGDRDGGGGQDGGEGDRGNGNAEADGGEDEDEDDFEDDEEVEVEDEDEDEDEEDFDDDDDDDDLGEEYSGDDADEEADTFLRLSEVEFCEGGDLPAGGAAGINSDMFNSNCTRSSSGRASGAGRGVRRIPSRHLSDFFRSPVALDSTGLERFSSIKSLSDVQTGARLFESMINSAASPEKETEETVYRTSHSGTPAYPVEMGESSECVPSAMKVRGVEADDPARSVPDEIAVQAAGRITAASPESGQIASTTAAVEAAAAILLERAKNVASHESDSCCDRQGSTGSGESEEEWLSRSKDAHAPDALPQASHQKGHEIAPDRHRWAGLNEDGSWRSEVARRAAGEAGAVEAERRRLAKINDDESWRADCGSRGGGEEDPCAEVRRDRRGSTSYTRLQKGNVRNKLSVFESGSGSNPGGEKSSNRSSIGALNGRGLVSAWNKKKGIHSGSPAPKSDDPSEEEGGNSSSGYGGCDDGVSSPWSKVALSPKTRQLIDLDEDEADFIWKEGPAPPPLKGRPSLGLIRNGQVRTMSKQLLMCCPEGRDEQDNDLAGGHISASMCDETGQKKNCSSARSGIFSSKKVGRSPPPPMPSTPPPSPPLTRVSPLARLVDVRPITPPPPPQPLHQPDRTQTRIKVESTDSPKATGAVKNFWLAKAGMVSGKKQQREASPASTAPSSPSRTTGTWWRGGGTRTPPSAYIATAPGQAGNGEAEMSPRSGGRSTGQAFGAWAKLRQRRNDTGGGLRAEGQHEVLSPGVTGA